VLACPGAFGQDVISLPCSTLVEWLGCAATIPGSNQSVFDSCAGICTSTHGCLAGSAFNASSGICELCTPGKIGRLGTQCEFCPQGKHQAAFGANHCLACATGRFSEAAGTEACTFCPANMSTCAVKVTELGYVYEHCHTGAVTAGLCSCKPGFLTQDDGTCAACPFGGTCCMCPETVGCYNSTLGDCDLPLLMANFEEFGSPCSHGCVSGSSRPLPLPGYAYDEVTPGSFDHQTILSCTSGAAGQFQDSQIATEEPTCIGGPSNNCTQGREGFLCAFCTAGHYKTNANECLACTEAVTLPRAVFVVLGIVFIVVGVPIAWCV
jgi:hypothetical protein